ncbi:MAG: GEVED domain-containing protein [Pirellulales bacterium]
MAQAPAIRSPSRSTTRRRSPLDAWIDFDQSATFDVDEHLGGGVSTTVAGGSNVIPFQIPAGSTVGPTYARFRLSGAGGLGPTGAAADGEVEDHLIEGIDADIPTVTQVDNTLTIVGTQGGSNISITDDGNRRVTVTTNNTISITYDGVERVRLDLGERDQIEYRYVGDSRGVPAEHVVVGFPIRDYGDAPTVIPLTSQPTSYGDASYLGTGPILGTAWDSESASQPHFTAMGDDLNGADDENGVTGLDDLRSSPTLATTTSISVKVSTPSSAGTAWLDAWIDFNADGDWDDAGERLGGGSILMHEDFNHIDVTVPAGTPVGTTFARFRISEQGGLDPTGVVANGEVEDYAVTINPRRGDYGDAPILLTAYGEAGHLETRKSGGWVNAGPSLGNGTDFELAGQPHFVALGDDLCPEGSDDDENGVSDLDDLRSSPMLAATTSISVKVSTPSSAGTAWLSAQRGDWLPPGRRSSAVGCAIRQRHGVR